MSTRRVARCSQIMKQALHDFILHVTYMNVFAVSVSEWLTRIVGIDVSMRVL